MSAIVPGHAYGALHGYWGQTGPSTDRLANYCDSGIEYVAVAFVNGAPENEPSGFPRTNFGSHCWADAYVNEDGVQSDLLSECRTLKEDITYCQEQGVKVILSIGGVYNDETADYQVTSEDNGVEFADFLYGAFGPKDESWTGPRPFDLDENTPTVVDGFDFDIEEYFDNYPYIAMIERFRELDSSLLITAAPECPTNPIFFKMQEMIEEAQFDALFIQFYNNPSCDARSVLPGDPFDTFNYRQWETVLRNSARSKDAKIFVGLPAAPDASRNGYVGPEVVKDIVCEYSDSPFWGGIGLWDLNYAVNNIVDGKTFFEHAIDALDYGCDAIPTTTTTAVSSTSTTSSSSSTSTSESTTAESTTAESTTAESTTAESTTAESTSSSSETTTPGNSTITSSSVSASVTSTPISETSTSESVSSSSESISSSSESVSSTSVTSNSVSSTSTVGVPTSGWNTTMTTRVTDGPIGPSTTPIMTTRTEFTTTIRTITDCPPYVVDCPADGHVVTEVIPIYTTVCPIDELPPKPTGVPCDGEDCPGHDEPGKPEHGDEPCDGEDCPGHDEPGKPGHDEPGKPGHDEPSKPGHDEPEHGDEPCTGEDCPGHDEPEHGDEPGEPGYEGPCVPPYCPAEPTKVITTIQTTVTVPGGGEYTSTITTKVPPPGTAPIPTGGWTSSPPDSVPTTPVEAGAAGLSVGMTVLAAVVAFQLL